MLAAVAVLLVATVSATTAPVSQGNLLRRDEHSDPDHRERNLGFVVSPEGSLVDAGSWIGHALEPRAFSAGSEALLQDGNDSAIQGRETASSAETAAAWSEGAELLFSLALMAGLVATLASVLLLEFSKGASSATRSTGKLLQGEEAIVSNEASSATTSADELPQAEELEEEPGGLCQPLLEDSLALLALKFLCFALLCMALTRLTILHLLRLHHGDQSYTLHLFLRQDFHKVVLDLMFLFVVGRIASPAPMPLDSRSFAIVVLASALVPSALDQFSFMRIHVSLYSMRCQWTAKTWLAALAIAALVLPIVGAHLWHFCFRTTRDERRRAGLEWATIFTIFVLPRAFEPSFHIHHWYMAWLLAQICCLPTVWSRGAQAFFIGCYINGVAMWGRDPVLACQAAYDLAFYQKCPFLVGCAQDHGSHGVYVPPNPTTCEAGDYA